MDITSREKAIIELIIKTSGKHTALSIATYLNVSARTIHRDLKAVEKILQLFELRLSRNSDKGLSIEGKNEQIFRLIQHLMSIAPIDRTPKEKKLMLLLALFHEETYKIQPLALYLGVSITTLTSYLDELTSWLQNWSVLITRKRGVGVETIASETNKRKAFANYVLHFFYEELIENLFKIESQKDLQGKILHYFQREFLYEINKLLNTSFNSLKPRLADSDFIGLIIHICITMQRAESGYLLEDESGNLNELEHEYNLIKEICNELETACSVSFSKADITYLAVILKGSKLQEVDDIPYDRVLLSQRIKALILNVSTQLHVNLTNDFSLYQGLLAHMEPSLFRIRQKMGMYNPLTEEIKRKYPVLFIAVKNGIAREFNEFEEFPVDEIAFIVLHFGSALVMQEEEIYIKALIVCPTGIGTSKMLASRLKREITEINSVDVLSIKDLQEQKNIKGYDVIISTVRLPLIEKDYILVSPLLTDENILTIKNFLRHNIESLTKNKQYKKTSQLDRRQPRAVKKAVTDILQDIKDVQQSIESILKNFRLFRMAKVISHIQIIAEMVRLAENDKLLSDAKAVVLAILDRERKGGLGIPNTSIGFFHTRHAKVSEFIFQISHLEDPCLVKGMDGKDMYMKSLLLMLAPENLSKKELEIVSLISTSIIENNKSIMIFSSSNEELILERLEMIFLDYLYTKMIRE